MRYIITTKLSTRILTVTDEANVHKYDTRLYHVYKEHEYQQNKPLCTLRIHSDSGAKKNSKVKSFYHFSELKGIKITSSGHLIQT